MTLCFGQISELYTAQSAITLMHINSFKKSFSRSEDPRSEYVMWQKDLTSLQMYETISMKREKKVLIWVALEMNEVCKIKGEKTINHHCILDNKVVSHGYTAVIYAGIDNWVRGLRISLSSHWRRKFQISKERELAWPLWSWIRVRESAWSHV